MLALETLPISLAYFLSINSIRSRQRKKQPKDSVDTEMSVEEKQHYPVCNRNEFSNPGLLTTKAHVIEDPIQLLATLKQLLRILDRTFSLISKALTSSIQYGMIDHVRLASLSFDL